MAGNISYIPESDGYQAGVCNIGPAEIARRRQAGYLGVAGAIALAVVLVVIDAPAVTRLLVALPLAAGFSGFIQARLRFCANYGWRGIRNLGGLGDTQAVLDGADRAVDRRRSLEIFGASALGGVSIAIVFALLPL
jgi:hypothetical protein